MGIHGPKPKKTQKENGRQRPSTREIIGKIVIHGPNPMTSHGNWASMAPNPMSSHGKWASIGLKVKIARAELGSQFRQGRCGLAGQCEGNGRIHDLGGAWVAMNTAGKEGEGCVPGVSVQGQEKVREE